MVSISSWSTARDENRVIFEGVNFAWEFDDDSLDTVDKDEATVRRVANVRWQMNVLAVAFVLLLLARGRVIAPKAETTIA